MTAPLAAADELERAVTKYNSRGAMIHGMSDNKFLDNPEFVPILEELKSEMCPIYLHPVLPPWGVSDIYYSGMPNHNGMSEALPCYGWGWHAETAVHVLCLVIAGIFDLYHNLKLIIGHMGEVLPIMLARMERAFKPGNGGANQRPIADTFHEQVYITTSRLFYPAILKNCIRCIWYR